MHFFFFLFCCLFVLCSNVISSFQHLPGVVGICCRKVKKLQKSFPSQKWRPWFSVFLSAFDGLSNKFVWAGKQNNKFNQHETNLTILFGTWDSVEIFFPNTSPHLCTAFFVLSQPEHDGDNFSSCWQSWMRLKFKVHVMTCIALTALK